MRCKAFEVDQIILYTHFTRLIQSFFGLFFKELTSTRLKFFRSIFVNTLNLQKLFCGYKGYFFKITETFRDQELSEEFIEIKSVHKELSPLLKLFLATLAFLRFGHDVNIETCQLTRETNILAPATDRKAKLVNGDNNLYTLSFFIKYNLAYLSRLQGINKECRLIFIPGYNINLFSLKFVNNRLHSAASHADTSTDRVNRIIVRHYGDFSSRSRIARH